MSDDLIEQPLNDEAAYQDLNQLNELGNRAIAARLIVGHGYRQGNYEILRAGEVLTFPPQAALAYLEQLLDAEGEAG